MAMLGLGLAVGQAMPIVYQQIAREAAQCGAGRAVAPDDARGEAIEPGDGACRLTAMARFFGEMLFALVRDLVWAEVNSFVWRIFLKVGAWLDGKISGRAVRVVLGLLLGFAAWGIFPLIVYLSTH